MKVHEVLSELKRLKAPDDALVSFEWGHEFIAGERMTSHSYEREGQSLHGVVLWNHVFANERLKSFAGLLTVARLRQSLLEIDRDAEVMCAATGYVSDTPRVINLIKTYEKVCKGQIRKMMVRLSTTNGEVHKNRITFRRCFKIVYNRYADQRLGPFTQELVGYASTLQQAERTILCHLETFEGNPERLEKRNMYDFEIIECYIP